MDAPKNNEDKQAWCTYGAELEKQFTSRMFDSSVGILKNPAKTADPYTHDLLAMFPSDLKSIRTVFRTANRYGFDPDYAITINEKDIRRYTDKYPNIVLMLDIEYPTYKGVRIATIYRLNKFIASGKAKRHEYMYRVDDSSGNAKASYIFDLRWFDEITL
jgi:hypothetical protein